MDFDLQRLIAQARETEREHCADLIQLMLTPDFSAGRIFSQPAVRLALAVARRAIQRGRHLTTAEQLANLKKAMDEADTEEA